MKNTSLALFGFFGISAIAACSGGGSGTGGGYVAPVVTHATTAPATSAPATSAPATSAPQSTTVLQSEDIDGGQAFVTSADLPVYTFDKDGADVSNCTGACLSAWPAVVPPAGVTLTAPWSSFKRSDNGTTQLAYNGAPLYMFSGDTAGVSNGNGTEGFSLARPAATATAAPTQAPTSAPGPY
jgi:predicted lipoprotein with Yx(FWY)xxD motif